MERLNYQHLFYFWSVAREGSITRACEKLRLAQPTISGQLAVFESAIGEKLFRKEGRRLALTEKGRIVFNYAEEIFALGNELTNTLKGRAGARGMRLSVGLVNALPKLIVYRLVEPALRMPEMVQVSCHEDKTDALLASLALHGVDLVLSDSPITSTMGDRVFSHFLGECGVALFAAPELAAKYRADFPRSLDRAPWLMPSGSNALRRSLDQWCDAKGIYPQIKAEIEDSALLKTFGRAGVGLFVEPVAVRAQIEETYGVEHIGPIDGVTERFYAITAQSKIKHPAIITILESARNWLF